MDFISREGSAVINVARYLLTTKVGDRSKTIDTLSKEIGVSIGFVQKAMATLEEQSAVRLSRQGRNGTFIEFLDEPKLVKLAGIAHMVVAMPLPYIKHYEGLASGIKNQLAEFPVFFAHMRGANVRAECLSSGTYDVAIMSKLAASQVGDGLVEAIGLGAGSYSAPHELIYREGEYETIKRIGVDRTSPDQRVLTELLCKDWDVDLVDIRYNEAIELLESRAIDATVWLPEAADMDKHGFATISLERFEQCAAASEAVLLVNKDRQHIKNVLIKAINIDGVRTHQQQVVNGEILPSY